MNIFQIYYSSEQISKLDPEFIPVYNAPNPQERWFEYGVMRQLWQNHHHYFDDFVGVLSHKFYEKTGLTGKEVKAHIAKHTAQNPQGGVDVYLFDPITAPSNLFVNQWAQGDSFHDGLSHAMQNLLGALKIPVRLDGLIDYSDTVVYCNYWVGSPRFWQAYMAFADEFYRLIEEDTDNQLGARSFVAHSHSQYPMTPFIMERLPTLFMRLNPQFKRMVYEYPEELLKKRWGVAYDDITALKHAKNAQDRAAIHHHMQQLFAKLTREQLTSLYMYNICP